MGNVLPINYRVEIRAYKDKIQELENKIQDLTNEIEDLKKTNLRILKSINVIIDQHKNN